MKEPTILAYVLLIIVSLFFALAGLYLLANFRRLFRGIIKNELARKNAAAWVIIFCISTAMLPLNGSMFLMLSKHGWGWFLFGQFATTTLCTLLIYNLVRVVSENSRLKKLSFVKHNVVIFLTLLVTTLLVNIPASYIIYGQQTMYIKYTILNSLYFTGTIALVNAVINYLDLERKRKFQEKELELSLLRELKAKAELDALHSKVNPHFLYNALNSIADLSITDGKKARKMTIALADLFRYSINYSRNNYSTVEDEVEMTDVYMQIEKIRFEDQLNYTLQVDEQLSAYLVPRFVLQPLVENAVKHGLKATGQKTEITLEVKLNDGHLELVISDSGPAFPADLNPGYGVQSVYDKMDLLFPGEYEILFSNEPRKQVMIRVYKLMKHEPAF